MKKGSFQGIDSLHIENKDDILFSSIYLYESASISISIIPDIILLNQKLYRENHIPKDTVNIMHKRAMGSHPDNVSLKSYLHGSTYMSL